MTAWRHNKYKNCNLAVGQSSVKLGAHGEVLEASDAALLVIQQWGAHAGFEQISVPADPEEQETLPPVPVDPPKPKVRRRGRPRKVQDKI